jgi:hypothetical protein
MSWMLFPENPVLSALVLFLIALPFLYAARTPVHGLFRALVRALAQPLRLAARWCSSAAQAIQDRNEVVLLAHGREELTQAIQREFERVTAIVRRDLQGYPALQRRLLDELTRIEEDYKKCGEVPPPPPEWTQAVEVIAGIKSTGDGLVQKILEDISTSINEIYEKVVQEYRRSYEERHKILEGFQPFWRSLEQTLTRVGKNLTGLEQNAAHIDAQIEKYEQILSRSEKAVHILTSSASREFVISAVVLAIAIGGALVNFKLIALPMSTMVGAGEYMFGDLKAADIAALVIILVETTMGLFVMETLRFTHLFPRIGNLPDKMRERFMWVALTFLFFLACVEVGLAVMRDWLVQANVNFLRSLNPQAADAATAAVAQQIGWVQRMPIAAQMILGFILPFALAFIAIPLEYFISSGRAVFGVLLVFVIRGIGLLLRMLSNLARHAATALTMLYDVLIFLPLLIERAVRSRAGSDNPAMSEVKKHRDRDELRKAG